jgi:hypothetical protein
VLADNKLALNAGWDLEILSLEIGELGEAGCDLEARTDLDAAQIGRCRPASGRRGRTVFLRLDTGGPGSNQSDHISVSESLLGDDPTEIINALTVAAHAGPPYSAALEFGSFAPPRRVCRS